MNNYYPIIKVPEDAWNVPEQLGTKFKFWYKDNELGKCLFKQGRQGTGENWAEKVCCEIAELLCIPHAHYEFATWRNHEGVVTPSLITKGSRLVLGNEVIRLPSGRYGNKGHFLRLVMAVMKSNNVKPPASDQQNSKLSSASDYFVGYLLLDALVGNQDRHDENWALIRKPDHIELAPTFDHASSLGRNESDKKRIERLNTKDKGYDVKAYVSKARSAFYLSSDDKKTMLTLDAFYVAAKMNITAGRFWLEKLDKIDIEHFKKIFDRIPDSLISSAGKNFALSIIKINKDALLALDI